MIRNSKEAKTTYALIRWLEASGVKDGDVIVKFKREVREWANRQKDRHYICDSGDAFTEVINVPVEAEDAAEEWFEQNEFLGYPGWLGGAIDWGADCTGCSFTIWHKIVRRGDRLVCFHRVGVDV